ncbi:unnamed protein product [Rangifer tarandus platyrhynchus]|uniref:Uncharacterized protein n=2 Tax=Rangifer tarandus platyrhynchus TaxID=3082113 RepID=A0AC59Y8V2_RANTA|nr:unnamed protein product [Rangifer tarandus platyrhynchus]
MLCKTGLPPRLASRAGGGAEALGKEEATPSWVSSPGETAALRAPGPPPRPPHLRFTGSAAPSLCGAGGEGLCTAAGHTSSAPSPEKWVLTATKNKVNTEMALGWLETPKGKFQLEATLKTK